MNLADCYHSLIEAIIDAAGCSDKTLHVLVGTASFLFLAMIGPNRGRLPFAAAGLFVLEMMNESLDFVHAGALNPGDTFGDVMATFAVPVLIWIITYPTGNHYGWRRGARASIGGLSRPHG
ncbi:hypothetical protein Q5H91_05690 [Sphingomonas sp. KR1UV-12]|uniref:VanZ-like domain-containing protein n=1 Tax=Sphingomonas aurea TaxID=3063994 RepID=A0ABT9EIA0_9SPHN|nr:hypothetical protein [Sphingomonas sp. KR1UV-12]MDP1026694.1 hypothetical protein [Sphingomonas sp. KR1UV-12]